MQKDNLEKFITQHREDFDDATPSLKVWAAIDKELQGEPSSKKKHAFVWMRVAAAGLLLLVSGIAIGYFVSNATTEQPVATLELPSEVLEMERYYQQEVKRKSAQLVNYQHDDNTLNTDLEQFDTVLEELKNELNNVPKGSEEKIINAMIQNYQAKIFVLDKVLQHIINQEKENQNDTIQI